MKSAGCAPIRTPRADCWNSWLATAYVAHNYGRSGVGWPSEVSQITATEAMEFHKKYYVGSNIVVAVVGDVKASEAMPMLERYFSRIPGGPKPEDMTTVEPKQFAEKSVVIKDPTQPIYFEGYHRPSYRNPDDAVYDAISDIMSNGRVSRLYRSLVRDQQIAAVAEGVSPFPGDKYPSLFVFVAVPLPGHTAAEMATAIHKEIDKLKTADVTDAELAMYKTRTRADLLRGPRRQPGSGQCSGRIPDPLRRLARALPAARPRRQGDQGRYPPGCQRGVRCLQSNHRRDRNPGSPSTGKKQRRRTVKNSGSDGDCDPWVSSPHCRFSCRCMLSASSLAPAQQQEPWEKIPIPPLHEFKPQQPKRIELKNGIVLFLQEDHELPFVSGSVLIPGGSRDEDPAKCGLIGLYGQTWRTSGTAKMSGDAMDDLLEAKAAHIETGGDDDSTALSWDSLKADADQVYNLAMDLLFHPKFDEQKLQLAKQQDGNRASSAATTRRARSPRAKRPSWYMEPTVPYTRQPEFATIGAVTMADLEAWHDRTIGGKLIVSISGDFDPAAMEAKLRATFEGLPHGQAAPRPPRCLSRPHPRRLLHQQGRRESVQTWRSWDSASDRRNPDVPSIAMMNESSRGGFASRLFQKVRTQLGLAYEVGGGLSLRLGPSGYLPGCGAHQERNHRRRYPANLQGARRIDDTALYRRRTQAGKRQHPQLVPVPLRHQGQGARRAGAAGVLWLSADYLETYKAALEKVTLADLNAVAKKYIHPDKYAVLVVGNGPEIKPALDALNMGPVHTIDITIPQPGAPAGSGSGAEKQE